MTDHHRPPLGYAGLDLDRGADHRHEPAFLEREAQDPSARTAVFVGDALVTASGADGAVETLFDASALARLGAAAPVAYLGRGVEGPRFVATLDDDGAAERIESTEGLRLGDLRALASDGRLAGAALALAGYAKSLVAWHARNGFCGNCGSSTEPAPGGWRRTCAACGALHFPRVDPVVIMLVTRGDRCLLGRQARFPPGMWSCLAGFVEPGETVEAAAAREIMEEAGVRVGAVTYELSQPWPFPSQLMIGVSAESLDETIVPDMEELEDARWFTRDEVATMLARTHAAGAFAPPPAAIAHHLLLRFVNGRSSR